MDVGDRKQADLPGHGSVQQVETDADDSDCSGDGISSVCYNKLPTLIKHTCACYVI